MKVNVNVEIDDIMKVLNKIQKRCLEEIGCRNCPFCLEKNGCQLKKLFTELSYYPTGWDLEEIKWLLNQ